MRSCPDFDDSEDSDGDLVPDGCDVCAGNDAWGDLDNDGVCEDIDLCPGFDDNLDADLDGVPDGCDICPGFDDNLDADLDGVPDGCDICLGDDTAGDGDGDEACNDLDCDDGDPTIQFFGDCGVCGGMNESCGVFEDGFESGDTTAWSPPARSGQILGSTGAVSLGAEEIPQTVQVNGKTRQRASQV